MTVPVPVQVPVPVPVPDCTGGSGTGAKFSSGRVLLGDMYAWVSVGLKYIVVLNLHACLKMVQSKY